MCLIITACVLDKKKDRARDPTAGWFLWIIWVGQAEEAMLDHRESVHLADGVLKQYLPVYCSHSCMQVLPVVGRMFSFQDFCIWSYPTAGMFADPVIVTRKWALFAQSTRLRGFIWLKYGQINLHR